jgi:hypothetical protein
VTKKKKNNLPGAGRVAEVVQHLPSKHETLKSQYHQRKKKSLQKLPYNPWVKITSGQELLVWSLWKSFRGSTSKKMKLDPHLTLKNKCE